MFKDVKVFNIFSDNTQYYYLEEVLNLASCIDIVFRCFFF